MIPPKNHPAYYTIMCIRYQTMTNPHAPAQWRAARSIVEKLEKWKQPNAMQL